ncbi:integumentary mucin C.1, partial [Cyclospora cayetanensis]|uniref:Integumentary mucin C.1 n=1 Tax=Cyclospora cayetanensis TaxID=88456 RepID=A0A6P6S3J8_9EIME
MESQLQATAASSDAASGGGFNRYCSAEAAPSEGATRPGEAPRSSETALLGEAIAQSRETARSAEAAPSGEGTQLGAASADATSNLFGAAAPPHASSGFSVSVPDDTRPAPATNVAAASVGQTAAAATAASAAAAAAGVAPFALVRDLLPQRGCCCCSVQVLGFASDSLRRQPSGALVRTTEVLVGDETGVVLLLVQSDRHRRLCQPGSTVLLLNALVCCVAGFVCLRLP